MFISENNLPTRHLTAICFLIIGKNQNHATKALFRQLHVKGNETYTLIKSKAVPLYVMKALGGRGV
jgi:hypothetical protein